MADQAGTATYAYDVLGRLTTETRSLIGANNAAIAKTISYSYNLDGSVKTLTYPSGKVITYTPDGAGRTVSAVIGKPGPQMRAGIAGCWKSFFDNLEKGEGRRLSID